MPFLTLVDSTVSLSVPTCCQLRCSVHCSAINVVLLLYLKKALEMVSSACRHPLHVTNVFIACQSSVDEAESNAFLKIAFRASIVTICFIL
jgi:hypothetical protein